MIGVQSINDFAKKIFLNFIELFTRWFHQLRITKEYELLTSRKNFFFLSIWLWKLALIGSKIEKRSAEKSWHFGNQNWWTDVMKRSFVLKKLWCTLILPQTTDTQWRHKSKKIWKFGLTWQTKYASAVPNNLK